MAIADLFTVFLIRTKEKQHKTKREIKGEVRLADFPTEDEIGQLIKDFKADRAIIVKEYELLPFE